MNIFIGNKSRMKQDYVVLRIGKYFTCIKWSNLRAYPSFKNTKFTKTRKKWRILKKIWEIIKAHGYKSRTFYKYLK